jgi:hypothetical protein
MHYEFVAPGLSAIAVGLSYWYSRAARISKEQTEASLYLAKAQINTQVSASTTAVFERAKTCVQSSNHEVCSYCNKLVARFERLADGSIKCANCA